MCAAVLICSLAMPRVDPIGRPVEVFASGEHPYTRTPGIAVLPNGRILVVAASQESLADESGNKILVKSSGDGGRTWGNGVTLAGNGSESAQSPVIVASGEKVFVHFAVFPAGTDSYHLDTGFGAKGQKTYVSVSRDGGTTWIPPVETTRAIRREGVQSVNFGPGRGIVLQRGHYKGRIVVPMHTRVGGAAASGAVWSDDGGNSWQSGATVEAPDGVFPNESGLAELEDGSLVFNARAAGGIGKRVQAVSGDGGATWSGFEVKSDLPDSVCHAGILRHRFEGVAQPGVLLLSMPSPAGRIDGLVRVSTDDGRTWPGSFEVAKGYFGYSALANLENGEVGLVYEYAPRGGSDPRLGIRFLRLKVSG
ncbi:MAG: exo-alpha-sialidase [Armatimonadetes bacterium]|nr:exo-alpha-sialidase [Armatimonadota bacterium]MBX3109099.1 exo-alpha-sialidase [Fimbriimonadaceae bacterium]